MAFDYLYQSTPTYSISYAKNILGTKETSPYTGHVDLGCELKGLGFPQQIHGLLKRFPEFPQQAQRAYVLRQAQGKYGWAGTHGHSYMEEILYRIIDLKHRLKSEANFDEIKNQKIATLIKEWKESAKKDFQSFTEELRNRRSGSPKALWLQEHAFQKLAGHALNTDDNSPVKTDQEELEAILNWLEPTFNSAPANLSEMIEGTSIEDWYVIEGKRIYDGLLVGNNGESQEELRGNRAQPFFYTEVDGEQIRIYCTLDFAYRVKDGLRIGDWKTGKTKDSYHDQVDLYGWAIMEMFPNEFDPEQISSRLIYPAADADHRYDVEQFNSKKLDAIREKTKANIRKILGTYSALGSKETTTAQALQSYIDTFPEKDAIALWALGNFARNKRWPTSVPQVRKPYPIEIHRDYSPTHFVPEAPSMHAVFDFMKKHLSPLEFTRGFSKSRPDYNFEQRIDQITEERKRTNQIIDSPTINEIIAAELFPSLKTEDILKAYDTSHLRMKLTFNTPANGAEEIPEHCQSCNFFNICDPGQVAFANHNLRKKIDWKDFASRVENKLEIKLDDSQIMQFRLYHEKLADFVEDTGFFDCKENDLVMGNYFDSLALAKFINIKALNNVLDISTDNAFSSIALKITFPHLSIRYMNTDNRKVEFVSKMVDRLKLENFTVFRPMGPNAKFPANWSEPSDLVITDQQNKSRELLKRAESLIGEHSTVAIYQKPKENEDYSDLNIKLASATLRAEKVENYVLPENHGPRVMVLMNKSIDLNSANS